MKRGLTSQQGRRFPRAFVAACISTAFAAEGGEAQTLLPPVGTIVRDCRDCPEMVAVPALGRSSISAGHIMYVGRFEVTWADYLKAYRDQACPEIHAVAQDKIMWPEYYAIIDDSYPVTQVSARGFECYTRWLGKKSGHRYRLPTGAEWEHFSRAGSKRAYPWGNSLGFNNAAVGGYFDKNAVSRRFGGIKDGEIRLDVLSYNVVPVGAFPPNAWGIYDVVGNALEYTTDKTEGPACSRSPSPITCDWVFGRGDELRPVTDDPQTSTPIAGSLLTNRYPVAAQAAQLGVGFRIIRE